MNVSNFMPIHGVNVEIFYWKGGLDENCNILVVREEISGHLYQI